MNDNTEHIFCKVDIDFTVFQRGAGKKADKASFQFPDVAGHVCRYKFYDVLRKLKSVLFAFFPENGNACFKIGRLNIGCKTALKTGYQTFIESF